MSDSALNVELRDRGGKGFARRLRAVGRVPAVVYGRSQGAIAVSFDARELGRLIETSHAGLNTLFDLRGDKVIEGKTVMVKELQRDPVKGTMLHADLYQVDATQTITVSVPLHIEGTATGVSLGGGILDHALREVDVDCLPNAIPDEILVDVRELELGESLHVRDLSLPEGVALRTDGDLSVVSVVAPQKGDEEVAETPVEGAEAAEGEAAAAPAATDGEPEAT
ncbi:MAG: 50S ribosomal protein L25 [Proteobacteria bacterium]|nr:50S ribosomal protein L25 [Pseudomonadota bacterium]